MPAMLLNLLGKYAPIIILGVIAIVFVLMIVFGLNFG